MIMTTEITTQEFNDAAQAAMSSPWAYIGVDAGIASLFTEQTGQVFSDALQFANDAKAGYLTDAQKFQQAADLWKDLASGLRSDLDGLRAQLSATEAVWADETIDGLQSANAIDDLIATKGVADFGNSVMELGRCLGGMVAAAQLIDALTNDNGPNGGPTAGDVAKAAVGIGVGLFVTAIGGVSLPAIGLGFLLGLASDWAWDMYSGEYISREFSGAAFWDVFFDFYTGGNVSGVVYTDYLLARGWRPPRGDPLVIDLDNDGIETVGISAGVLFDHNADGIKTGTGWLKPDDGFLVLDRNGNGTIDSGRELFGVDTVLSNGLYAPDGFTALADLDTNGDHVFNAADAQFANVRVWRDLNQDGVSQANELFTLASLGITAIDLNAHTATKTLAGGNTQTLAANVAGLEGPAVNLNLDQNPFYSQFTDSVPLTPQTEPLPDMQGAGALRDLREAATLSPALATKLATLQSTYLTRDQFMAQLGSVLTLWANTSGLQSSVDWGPGYYMSKEQVCLGMGTINVTTLMTPADRAIQAAQDVKRPQLLNEISVLERFNGLTFITRNADGTIILGNGNQDPIMANPGGGGDTGLPAHVSVPIILPDPQVALIDQAYQALVDSVYDALALQTRLKGYVDSIGLNIDDTGITLDFAPMAAMLASLKATDARDAYRFALADGGGATSKAATSISSRSASWHRMRSEGLPMPRSICETKVRSMSASRASRSWESPSPRRRARRLAASAARFRSNDGKSMAPRMTRHGLSIHGI
jgi:hypothetical protein